MFTEDPIDEFDFVSNHFNLQIQPQTFNYYMDSVNSSLQILRTSGIPILDICYNRLMNKESRNSEIAQLEDFICAKVNANILKTPS